MLSTDIQDLINMFTQLDSLKIKNRNYDIYTGLAENNLNLRKLFILVPVDKFVHTMNLFIRTQSKTLQDLTLKKEGKDDINKELVKCYGFAMPYLTSLNLINLNEFALKDYIKTVMTLSLT